MTLKGDILHDTVSVPATMSDALDYDDPVTALHLLSKASQDEADRLAKELFEMTFKVQLPDILLQKPQPGIETSKASADSILHCLTKIASGGSQASQEIRALEQEKSELDQHAEDVAIALKLRQSSQQAAQALQAEGWQAAASALRPYLDWKELQTERSRAYIGEYAIQQLEQSYEQLKDRVLALYQQSVEAGDLKSLGNLTPVLSTISLESQGVKLYLQFLKSTLQASLAAPPQQQSKQTPPPYVPMARIYNTAVNCLRHHLPLVSHCLHRADGDIQVVQLVHAMVQENVLPLLARYQRDKQLTHVSQEASRIFSALEERYAGRSLEDEDEEAEDCGFSTAIGSLSDVDAAMEETALLLQHAESYLRFMNHTCQEVNRARQIRFHQEQRALKLERERQGWAQGRVPVEDDQDEEEYKDMVILDPNSQLHLSIAEVGGQYASIERCLLLASMQRGFTAPDSDPRYYRQLSFSTWAAAGTDSVGGLNQALQTAVVDTCLFAARRSTQRAYATGHMGTAAAMTNFAVDCLNVLLEVLSHRAEENGVAMLKPGEGLLAGAAGIFNATNLIQRPHHVTLKPDDEFARKQKMKQETAKACSNLNDLEVACHYCMQMETLLAETTEKGFPPGHDKEQLLMCVKSLRAVTDSFKVASNAAVESLESVLRTRIRSIVGDAVGGEGSSAAGFMGSTVAGMTMTSGGKGKGDRGVLVRMNYKLDDETYNMQQLSEGYIARLCYLLDDLLEPLRTFLAPRLWDTLLLQILGTVSKRLETSLRKCEYTSLGALALDSDVRDLLGWTKSRLYSPDYSSNVVITKACQPLARLMQISKLVNVDDLDDVLDLIATAKRKHNWDLKLEDTKTFLSARVEFDTAHVHELLRLPEGE